MNIIKLLNKFTKKDVLRLATCLNSYYPLVKPKRIYNLMLQVDSIDTTLHLLSYHENSGLTLDEIVFIHLQGKDNA